MSWFSRSDLEAKNTALEQENETLRSDLQAAQEAANVVPALTQQVSDLTAEVTAAEAKLKEEQEAHGTTKKALEDTEAKLKPEGIAATVATALEKPDDEANKPIIDAVQAEVSRQVAATGRAPVNTKTEEAAGGGTKTITRAEFGALSPAKRNAFIREGGKLTD